MKYFGRVSRAVASGRAIVKWIRAAPRKRDLTLYIMAGFDRYEDLLAELGPHKTGKSCLYVKRLSDIDLDVLARLIKDSAAHVAAHNGCGH